MTGLTTSEPNAEPSASGPASETTPLPATVVTTGAPSFSTRARSSSWAPRAPPPSDEKGPLGRAQSPDQGLQRLWGPPGAGDGAAGVRGRRGNLGGRDVERELDVTGPGRAAASGRSCASSAVPTSSGRGA